MTTKHMAISIIHFGVVVLQHLFRLDAGRLDDRPPLLDLSLFWKAPSASGVCWSRGGIPSRSARRVRTFPSGEGINDRGFESVDDIPAACPSAPQRA